MVIADLEIHSRFARACSKTINAAELTAWAVRKGVQLLATGDVTHPLWRRELSKMLVEREPGLFVLKEEQDTRRFRANLSSQVAWNGSPAVEPRFVLGGEVSLMFRQGEKKGRRVHLLFLAPSFAAVERLVALINDKGKLASDGRVILSMSCRDFAVACQTADPQIMVIPAHIWTPWFGLLGSKSGFDSIEEAFGDQASYIRAYETGLSANPEMCWRVESLRNRVLISSSDAHSSPNIMREATLLNGEMGDYSYDRLQAILTQPGNADYYGTLEFYPEEGKYHADGHAACKVIVDPEKTKALEGRCPVCGQLLTVGVLHRVQDLATYKAGDLPAHAGNTVYAVPLPEIIAEALRKGKTSKAAWSLYLRMTDELGSEYHITQERTEFPTWVPERVVEGIEKVRRGDLIIQPGYDGVYGVVKLFSNQDERLRLWK